MPRPHILFTLVDDWGYELWPRAQSPHEALLPRLRQTFVDEGMTLERHYTYSYCAPSRQSLLSGRQPLHVNEENSVCSGIPRGMRTLGDVLQSAGYRTHWIGKWHAGFSDPSATPARRGFSNTIGFFMKAHHHFSWCSYLGFEFAMKQHTACRAAPSNRSVPLLDLFAGTSSAGDAAIGARHPLVVNRTYSTTLFGSEALQRIRDHPSATSESLFLFLSLSATHKPYLAPPSLLQRATLAHPARYFRECPWVQGSPVKCRASHRKGYEAMALGVDDLVGELRAALEARGMWDDTLMVFASDNGGPIGPQASNLPLRGGKDNNLEGGVRTLAALGGGFLPRNMRGRAAHAFMHESDWLATLAHLAGTTATDERAASLGLPPIDSRNLWPILSDNASPKYGEPRSIVLATRFGLPGTPFGGTSALLDVRADGAFKLIRGVVCECPECRPCLLCNVSRTDASSSEGGASAGWGCVFDVINDPRETVDLTASRPDLLQSLSAALDGAAATKFIDDDPVNQECFQLPKEDPDHWLEVALAKGAVMQPWLKKPSRRGAKPRLLYPTLKRGRPT